MRNEAISLIGKRSLMRFELTLWKIFGQSTIIGNMALNQDFKEFIQSLNDNQVRYLVVGGYAVAFHGHPRYTKDIDIWVELDIANAARIIHALDQFGFSSLGLKESDFLEKGQFIQLGYEPSRIDIMNTLEGVNFSECYSKRIRAIIDGIEVNFIDLENLRLNKKAVGRYQDLADLEKLE